MKDTPEILKASFTHLYLFQCSNLIVMFEISTAMRIKYHDMGLSLKSFKIGMFVGEW